QAAAALEGPSAISDMAFSHDGQWFATGGWDATIRLWSLKTRQPFALLRGHTGNDTHVLLTPDGMTLLATDGGGRLQFWPRTSPRPDLLSRHRVGVAVVGFSPDGRRLASVDGMGELKLWDVAGRRATASIPTGLKSAEQVAFSPDGKLVAFGDDDNQVKLWDV